MCAGAKSAPKLCENAPVPHRCAGRKGGGSCATAKCEQAPFRLANTGRVLISSETGRGRRFRRPRPGPSGTCRTA
ncbi:hypothetical protein BS330_11865 [Amycolatopsis keratiniphila subsp. nogabecina]|uniref:Uncharacterized protein n=1 Tax=Amycolatopsis keratiniphila subsp. keratiniphila TaxID=227715 RepID=A0A1W2LVQ1_9PSEU|nr:hypothetical protein BS330_11865 [Amycolatopsis keratiniphila subsp. nogabecina]ONF69921.1 hypothetical protein AVR91_0216760 [Amycolatopsis keratiniphila subsp. keratiniphila]